jgi:sugar O-acyltransferase (sialic acid O-acetyltransferase NeuD family)
MSVLILGAGGHGKVIADILLKQGVSIAGFLDDNPSTWGSKALGLPILGGIDEYTQYTPTGLILGIGSNQVRQRIVSRLGQTVEPLWINAVHPTATIALDVQLGKGVVLAAQTVINTGSRIGNHVIVNTGATIDHDCNVQDFCHIAPGVHMAGGVTVGTGTLLGIGAAVTPYRTIGAWSTVGAGATVVHDIPEHVTAMGTPAHWKSQS